jgi:N-acetylmuramoyl-L-alanine amidase
MNRFSLPLVVLIALLLAAAGCRSSRPGRDIPSTRPAEPMSLDAAMRLIDDREAWTDHPMLNIPRHPAEKHLAGMIIVLDPGHGGEDGGDSSKQPPGYKAGPTGVKEAHMNLRVAHLLRRLLVDAGATVVMTREGDDTIDLRERAEVANSLQRPDGGRGADLFISIHHNAVGNPDTNYTSVWYHGTVDNNEVELDVAKYIGHALGREMRTDVARTSPILSSHLMYPTGFGVLRACHVPAILLECSFYTNPAEEQRLRDAGYNLREAYGIYVGLCEYAYGGRPTQSPPVASMDGSTIHVTTVLDEGLPKWWGADRPRIVSSTIAVLVNGQRVPFAFDGKTKELVARVPGSLHGEREESILEIHHANLFKHHNWPQRYQLRRDAGADTATLTRLPAFRDAERRPRPTTGPSTGRTPRTPRSRTQD